MIGNAWEMPAQLDHGGQLAALIIGEADRLDRRFIDYEHGASLDWSGRSGKRRVAKIVRWFDVSA